MRTRPPHSTAARWPATLGVVLLAATAGCDKPSGMFKTAYLWASFSINDSGDDAVRPLAFLKQETESGDDVRLSDGDRVECNGRIILDQNSEKDSLPRAPDGIYEFVLVRSDETVSTKVEAPAGPEIIRVIPKNGILHAGDAPMVTWDATRPEPNIRVDLNGVCVEDVYQPKAPDSGEAILPPLRSRDDGTSTGCTAILALERKRTGVVSSAFRGGRTEAMNRREARLSYVLPR